MQNLLPSFFVHSDTDWKLAELIVNIQFVCQRYYFGAMAEAYFDNKLKDAATNVRHQQKTQDGYARLPEEFVVEDVIRCFGLNKSGTARMKINRLIKDGLVEKTEGITEDGHSKARFRKASVFIL